MLAKDDCCRRVQLCAKVHKGPQEMLPLIAMLALVMRPHLPDILSKCRVSGAQ